MIERLKLRTLLADRGYSLLLIAMTLLMLAIIIIAAIYIRPGELRIPVRYSRFDSKIYTLEQWYYLLNYVLFAVIVWVAHLLVSAKLYQAKGRIFALSFVAAGVTVLVVTLVYFLSIVKVVTLTQ